MTVLSRDDAKAFLTKDDLETLERNIIKSKVRASLSADLNPCIEIRGRQIPLFTALELIGTL